MIRDYYSKLFAENRDNLSVTWEGRNKRSMFLTYTNNCELSRTVNGYGDISRLRWPFCESRNDDTEYISEQLTCAYL